MVGGTVVCKEHWRRRDDLNVNSVAIHFRESNFWIPTGGVDMTEESVAQHDFSFAGLRVSDAWPVGSAVTRIEVGPLPREEVIMNVDDGHLLFVGMNRATVLALAQTFVGIELLKEWWQIF